MPSRHMLAPFCAALVLGTMPLAVQAQTQTNWKCSAPGLRYGEYKGGDRALIHLEGFSRGGRYAVTKKGNIATGVTASGVAFTCKAS